MGDRGVAVARASRRCVAGVAQQQLTRVDRALGRLAARRAPRTVSRRFARAIDDAVAIVEARGRADALRSVDRSRAARSTQLDALVDARRRAGGHRLSAATRRSRGPARRASRRRSHARRRERRRVAVLSRAAVRRTTATAPTRASSSTLLGADHAGRPARQSPLANADRERRRACAASASSRRPIPRARRRCLRYATDGRRLFDVRANPLVQGEVAQRIAERARARAGVGVRRRARRASSSACGAATRHAGAARRRARRRPRVHRARSAQPVLESHAAVRSRVYFTPSGGPLTGNAGALATTSAIVLLGMLAVFRRRATSMRRDGGAIATILLVVGARSVSAARARARRSGSAARRRRAALADLGDSALSRRGLGAARRRGRGRARARPRRGLSPWVAPVMATRRRGARAGRLGSAGPLAVVVHDPVGRRDRDARAEPSHALRHSQRVGGRGARRDDARVGAHGARARRRGGARSRGPEPGRLRSRSRCCSASARARERLGADDARQALLQRYVASDIAAAGQSDRARGVADRQRAGRATSRRREIPHAARR